MGKGGFQDRINAWLQNTGEQVSGSGGSAVRLNQMYVDDINMRLGKRHANSEVKLALAVYVEEQDAGSEHVTQVKKRHGLFVVVDTDFILGRDLSWGRTKYEGFLLSDFTAEPITFKPKGREELPGVRLRAAEHSLSFSLAPWYLNSPSLDGMRLVRDRMIELVTDVPVIT